MTKNQKFTLLCGLIWAFLLGVVTGIEMYKVTIVEEISSRASWVAFILVDVVGVLLLFLVWSLTIKRITTVGWKDLGVKQPTWK